MKAADERGSAIVDFLLVSLLVTVLMLGVVQLALTLHVRNILIDSAGEGARYAALDGRDLKDGEARTQALITSTLPRAYAEQIEARTTTLDGVNLVQVQVRGPVPVLGLLGPSGWIDVTGRAVIE
ncbi:MAG TPA: TadE/TadG family type IV pilus assembly protein [Beutenbergiaceae bacterium]|nr:TadE/TadG family type IV pilus assembly protein [Beutenbergiaceae bacterium]